MDDEDFEYSVIGIAEKLKINLENSEQNPYYDKVHTIEDVVYFLFHQKQMNSHT